MVEHMIVNHTVIGSSPVIFVGSCGEMVDASDLKFDKF
jgi:hypothetical protein